MEPKRIHDPWIRQVWTVQVHQHVDFKWIHTTVTHYTQSMFDWITNAQGTTYRELTINCKKIFPQHKGLAALTFILLNGQL